MSVALLITVLLLAASNGANDNFKGVAALYGSRTVSYPVALGWASVTTLAGSLASVWLAQALLTTFTGAGLVTVDIATQTSFALAVALGAALTIALVTWRGLPVSTTHALLGAIVRAGASGGQGGVDRRVMKDIMWSWLLTLLDASRFARPGMPPFTPVRVRTSGRCG